MNFISFKDNEESSCLGLSRALPPGSFCSDLWALGCVRIISSSSSCLNILKLGYWIFATGGCVARCYLRQQA
ncbi:hypothetical protein CYMTET_36467 [Cymbomonas tetramitiformis]|uniref:Uncharacterized protein n=1 Tax=Cymbomonas tetramitiformis TaxID=36881 RepID=A0AAE0CHM2_9CHLO|nr:hypothetical protein CYMTET_36467 [Cymbomonas tetramitiformis]